MMPGSTIQQLLLKRPPLAACLGRKKVPKLLSTLPWDQSVEVRVCFRYVPDGPVSVLALQTEDKQHPNAEP